MNGDGQNRRQEMMKDILLVCIGSFVGGGARYAISKAMQLFLPTVMPWGTLTVNVVGCFLIGLLSGLLPGNHTAKLILVTGFCGGFTTFSTFMNENFQLGRDGHLLWAMLYTAASVVLGLLAVMAGYQIVK